MWKLAEPGWGAVSDDLTIAIPTLNSNRHLDIILGFYRQHDIPVTVFVDDRSVDETLATAQRLAANTVSISNSKASVVEALIETISRMCPTKWVLRIDDDELPSLALIRFAVEAIRNEKMEAYGFLRHQCAVSAAGTLLHRPDISPSDHCQWRLYQPNKVSFIDAVHTPGFKLAEHAELGIAPEEACLVHLDWAVRSYEERGRKVEAYDRHTPEAGGKWRSFYLYEEEPAAGEMFNELAYPEFAKSCHELSRRFPELCVASPGSVRPVKPYQSSNCGAGSPPNGAQADGRDQTKSMKLS